MKQQYIQVFKNKNFMKLFIADIISRFVLLFRTGPISFNLFQRLPGSLRHEFPDNQHIRHAHEGEQEECSGGGKILEHPGG